MDFPAACVDWDGTLFKDGHFQDQALGHAKKAAMQRGLPLVIWTGGDVKAVYKKLAETGIDTIRVCRKQDCSGLKARWAMDDQSQQSLKDIYGIDVQEFENV